MVKKFEQPSFLDRLKSLTSKEGYDKYVRNINELEDDSSEEETDEPTEVKKFDNPQFQDEQTSESINRADRTLDDLFNRQDYVTAPQIQDEIQPVTPAITPDISRPDVPSVETIQQAQPERLTRETIEEILKGARSKQDLHDLATTINRSMQQISGAMAGVKPDLSGAEALAKKDYVKEAGEKIKAREMDEENAIKAVTRDPASDISKQAREMYFAITGNKLPDTVSAEQLQKAGLPLGNLASMKSSQEAKKELKQIEKEQKEALKLEKIETKNDEFIRQSQQDMLKPFQEFQKVKRNYTATARVIDQIEQGIITPGSGDVQLLYGYIKSFDPNSVVRGEELKLGERAESAFRKAGVAVKNLTGGDLLSPKFRKSIRKIAENMYTDAQNEYKEIASPRVELAKSRGISEERIKKELLLGEMFPSKGEEQKTSTQAPHGYRVKQGGKTYIWDGTKYVEEK